MTWLDGVNTLLAKTEVSCETTSKPHLCPITASRVDDGRVGRRDRACMWTVMLENDGAQLPQRTTLNT